MNPAKRSMSLAIMAAIVTCAVLVPSSRTIAADIEITDLIASYNDATQTGTLEFNLRMVSNVRLPILLGRYLN